MRYIGALDVGTTTVRFHILDENADTVASSTEKVELLYPEPGRVEIDPEQLWRIIVKVIKDTLTDSNVKPESVVCLGISTQRGSFTTWNLKDGNHYHRFLRYRHVYTHI